MKTILLISTLVIFTLSGSALTQEIEYVNSTLWTNVFDVEVDGNYAYCVFSNGLVVIDVANPGQPEFVSRLYLHGSGKGIDVSGNYAYIADFHSGLKIVDIFDPANPALISGYDTPGLSYDVFIEGDYAYIADSYPSGLQIINVQNPASPVFTGSYDSLSAQKLYVSGQYAYITPQIGNLNIINVSDPQSPSFVASVSGSYDARGVYVSENYAYVIRDIYQDRTEFRIFDISDPANPVTMDFIDFYTSDPRDIYLYGDLAFIVDRFYLHIVDVEDPANIFEAGSISSSGYGIYGYDEFAYIAGGNNGLAVFYVSDPSNPLLAGMFHTPDNTDDVYISGNYAYTASNSSGLYIMDISNPYDPAIVSNHGGSEGISKIFISDNYAYTANKFIGSFDYLGITDLSDLHNPVQRGFYDSGLNIFDIQVSANYAFLANPQMIIVDVTDPDNPGHVWTYSGWAVLDLFVDGNYAYAALGWSYDSLLIFDISDPENPAVIGNYSISNPRDIFVHGGYAYIPRSASGLDILDVSDPSNPVFVANCNPPDWAQMVYVAGDYAYLAGLWNLDVIDISDPYNPIPLYNYETNYNIEGLFVSGEYIYVADGGSLLILRHATTDSEDESVLRPRRISFLHNYPNPFNASTTIEFNLPEAVDVELSIYNILGQKIATLFDERKAAGDYSVTWNAIDYPSGVYFARIETENYSNNIKMVLLK